MAFSYIRRACAFTLSSSRKIRATSLQPAQVEVIAVQVVRGCLSKPRLFFRSTLPSGQHDLLHDLILQGKDVLQGTVIAFGPQMPVRSWRRSTGR